MGVGDRHSKRFAGDKAKPSAIQRPAAVGDHALDDPFSAWDDDDAGAQRPSPHARLATPVTSALAQTRIERRGAGAPALPAQRAPTMPDGTPPVVTGGSTSRPTPLADSLLDPIAMRDIVISRVRTLDDPLTTGVLAEIARSAVTRDLARVEHAPKSPEERSRTTRDDIAVPRRRTERRPISREEPFRKK